VETRAACLTAFRVHVARLALGRVEEPGEEAEAGALIEAKDAAAARFHARRLEAIVMAIGEVRLTGGDDGDDG